MNLVILIYKMIAIQIFKKIAFLISLSVVLGVSAQHESEKSPNVLIFGSSPDPHFGDGAAFDKANPSPKRRAMYAEMQKAGCEYVMIPGDWAGGHWEQEEWVKAFGAEPKKRILSITSKVYGHLKSVMDEYKLLPIICPGDHEYGDNPWQIKSERAYEFPYYREGFANAFFMDENGKNKHIKKSPHYNLFNDLIFYTVSDKCFCTKLK